MEVSEAIRQARYEVGVSQEEMAYRLGVARRTVQNWESGKSEPTVGQAIKWFQILGKSTIPYLIQIVIPALDKISSKDDDEKLLEALHLLIEELPPESVRQLLYLFYGDHGSSPRAILQLVTAHLQTPMKDRVTQARVVAHNYELAKKKGTVVRPDHIQPDLEFLKEAIAAGEDAVLNDAAEYSVGKTED